MLSDIPRPLGFAVAAVAVAQALTGHTAAARATYDRLARDEPALADEGRADLLAYEGRLDDAEDAVREQRANATPAEISRHAVMRALGVGRGDLSSIFRLIHSELEITLSSLHE